MDELELVRAIATIKDMKDHVQPDSRYENSLEIALTAMEEMHKFRFQKMSNADWKELFSQKFGVSKSVAKNMLHLVMSYKNLIQRINSLS